MFEKLYAPFDLFGSVIQLRDSGAAEAHTRSGSAEPGMWTVAAIHADSDQALHADVWERHPCGHEVLCVLSGVVKVYFRDHGDGMEPAATVASGQSFIVPAGQWHRLTLGEPAHMLVITPRTETQHERVGGKANSQKRNESR